MGGWRRDRGRWEDGRGWRKVGEMERIERRWRWRIDEKKKEEEARRGRKERLGRWERKRKEIRKKEERERDNEE